MRDVIVVIGAGSIGVAIARRVGVGKHVLMADIKPENAEAAAETMLDAGYEVSIATADISSRESIHALVEKATGIGNVTGIILAAGVSPSQASPATILKVDLYGTALVLEEFGNVISAGGNGIVISSQSGHRLPGLTVEQNKALATTPVEDLLDLEMLRPENLTDSLQAYQNIQACEFAPGNGRGSALGKERSQGQRHQSRHHLHTARQRRVERSPWRRISAHDRAFICRAWRHT